MTRIPAGRDDIPAPLPHKRERDIGAALDGSRGDLPGRDSQLLNIDLGDSPGWSLDPNLSDRSDLFRQKMQAAEDDQSHGADAEKLAADGLIQMPQPLQGVHVLTPGKSVEAIEKPQLRERVLASIERCEKALTGELYMQAGRPVAVDLPLGDLVPGLDRITINLAGDRLEIAIFRSGPSADADLSGAAEALADRLQSRFARRNIRIVEHRPVEGVAPRRDDEVSLSSLFAPGRAPN